MNVYDSQVLAGVLEKAGFQPTRDLDKAGSCAGNTCAIRHKAEEKAFSFLGRFAGTRIKEKGPVTIMAGCVAQKVGAKAFERLPLLDLVLGTQAFERLGSHLEAIAAGKTRLVDTDTCEQIFEGMPQTSLEDPFQVSRFVTIMQGCENFCTYCVVPYVRGKEKSREPFAIIEEMTQLAASGVKEITLLGQNVKLLCRAGRKGILC